MRTVLVLLSFLAATVEPAPVAVEQESHHHLLFANAFVKVFDVEVPAGAVMEVHTHPTDHLAIIVEGARLRNEVAGEAPVDRTIGDPGAVVFLPAGPPHRQLSLDDHSARWIGVELVGAHGAGKTEAVGPHYDDVLNNARVQAARLTLEPGQRIDRFPFSPPYLQVAITPGDLQAVREKSGAIRENLAAGSARWEERRIRSLVNLGARSIQMVFLRLK